MIVAPLEVAVAVILYTFVDTFVATRFKLGGRITGEVVPEFVLPELVVPLPVLPDPVVGGVVVPEPVLPLPVQMNVSFFTFILVIIFDIFGNLPIFTLEVTAIELFASLRILRAVSVESAEL